MKKSIFVLIVLLAVLIVTCVYQKTYEIYSTSPKEITLIERKSTTQSTAPTAAVEKKEEKTSIVPVATAPIATKPVEVKPVPAVKAKPEMKVVSEVKPVVKTEKTVVKEVKKEAAPSTKNSTPAPKVPTVLTEEVNAPKSAVSSDKKAPVAVKTGEEEIVDYVMWAMKNRDIAMKNRDQVIARIQELIAKAINDRKIALDEREIVLDERSKNEIELQKLQTEQIDSRDASYESVTNPKTTNQGEK